MQRLLLTPDNIRFFASFLHPSANIQERVISFGPTAGIEKLLEVPLGVIDPRGTIIITLAINKSHPNSGIDSDIRVGISDGTTDNTIFVIDLSNYIDQSPCFPLIGEHDNTLVSPGTQVPALFKLIFTPFYKYAACETAQEGGYINTGTFNDQIDISKPLSLRVYSDDDIGEEYFVHSLDVEIY